MPAPSPARDFPVARLEPLGDRGLILRFGDQVAQATEDAVQAFTARLLASLPTGVLEVVPAFTTVALHLRPGTDIAALEAQLRAVLAEGWVARKGAQRLIEIPVCYGGEHGPDLEEVAAACGLTAPEVIALHAASPHRVSMLGFAPGFPYMAGLDPRLAMPRRSTPRVRIAPGTVAIARDQSAVYTLETPGGWNLIGRTPVALFTPQADPPTLLQPGDRVRFVPMTPAEFAQAQSAARQAGPASQSAAVGEGGIEVLRPGPLSALQDGGRIGFQRLGVIASGVMDAWAHRMANLLVANPDDEATLEITLMGPALRFRETALIAITGADLSPTVDGQPVPMATPLLLRAGAQLAFGRRAWGCRASLAVHGGFAVAPVMGSRSTYLRAGFGGFAGRALRKGDLLALSPAAAAHGFVRLERALAAGDAPFAMPAPGSFEPPVHPGARPARLRVIQGSQWGRFTAASRAAFLDASFTVSPQSDRMGVRLGGPALALEAPLEMISEAVAFGTVQVPPDGQPIVLMADRQTTGGYPRIAAIASVDLPRLAQAVPGEAIGFAAITLEEARALDAAHDPEAQRIQASLDALRRT